MSATTIDTYAAQHLVHHCANTDTPPSVHRHIGTRLVVYHHTQHELSPEAQLKFRTQINPSPPTLYLLAHRQQHVELIPPNSHRYQPTQSFTVRAPARNPPPKPPPPRTSHEPLPSPTPPEQQRLLRSITRILIASYPSPATTIAPRQTPSPLE